MKSDKSAKRILILVIAALLAVIGSASAAAGDPIRVGGNLELSGPAAPYGDSVTKAIRLAFDEVNKSGGVLGREIDFVVIDNHSKPERAADAMKTLVNEKGVSVVIGCVTSADTLAAYQPAHERRVPVVSPSATNPAVTVGSDGMVKQYAFRSCFEDPFQGQVMARFAADILKARSAAVVSDTKNQYSQKLAERFISHFTGIGGKIVAQETYRSGDTDFGTILARIRDANPGVVFIPGYYNESGLIIKQAREAGITVPLLGADDWNSPKLGAYAGTEALNNTFYSHHYVYTDKIPRVVAFEQAYRKKYGKSPDVLAAVGYESALVVIAAIKKAGSADPERIRATLEGLTVDGLLGSIVIDADHNVIKSAVVLRFSDGQPVPYKMLAP